MVLWLGGLHGELADDAVVAGLGVGADLPGVDPDQIGVTLEHKRTDTTGGRAGQALR